MITAVERRYRTRPALKGLLLQEEWDQDRISTIVRTVA